MYAFVIISGYISRANFPSRVAFLQRSVEIRAGQMRITASMPTVALDFVALVWRETRRARDTQGVSHRRTGRCDKCLHV
jgi:hypothetical protein